MALLPNQVQLPPDLSSVFSGIGTGAYNKINANYGRAKSDMPYGPTGYRAQRMNAQQGLDIGNLESGLGLDLGDASYKNKLSERAYGQQGQLTNAIADAMRPSMLEQIFAGIGNGAQAAGQGAALYRMFPRNSGTPSSLPTAGGYGAYDNYNPYEGAY